MHGVTSVIKCKFFLLAQTLKLYKELCYRVRMGYIHMLRDSHYAMGCLLYSVSELHCSIESLQ